MKGNVFETIDGLAGIYADLLEEVCAIESNSADFEGIVKVGETLCNFARSEGFSTRQRAFENAGTCYVIEMNADSEKPAIMLSGHMDTVYEKGVFGYPPVRREQNKLYGPGVADCKGGIVTALLSMSALKQCGFTCCPVRLFLQCDEEVGSRYSGYRSLEFMLEEAQKCAAFLNCESARPGKITLTRKGILKMEINIVGKRAHAKDFFQGASAVSEAGYKLVKLAEASKPDGIAYNCTLKTYDTPSNVVPDRCGIVIDVRVASMQEASQASALIEQVAKECTVFGTSGTVTKKGLRPPMEPSQKNTDLFNKINIICQKHGMPAFEPYLSAGGSDASNVSQAGIPCVDSMGIEGGKYHTLEEYCDLSSMAPRAKVLAAVIMEYDYC